MEQRRRAYTQAACLNTRALRQGKLERLVSLFDPTAVSTYLQKPEGSRRLNNIAEFFAEEPFRIMRPGVCERLRYMVAIGYR